MRFFPTIYLASGAAAAAVVRTIGDSNCVLSHRVEMAVEADCGSREILKTCFANLESQDVDQLVECYKKAGCSNDDSFSSALGAEERCVTVYGGGELRKRTRGELDARMPEATPMAMPMSDIFPDRSFGLFRRESEQLHGDKCLKISDKSTTACETITTKGKTTTGSCSSTVVKTSSCSPEFICTLDGQNEQICFKAHDTLDVAGIIVAIVMAVGAIAGIVTITYLCIQNKKEQKRLTAKAEATALARAATKKKRAAEQRTPLMNQGAGASATGGDPFADRNRS